MADSDTSPERTRMLTSPDGTPIWAESAGDATRPPLVFVHGLSCTALGWDKQFADPAMQRAFHLVRYEMRGHGRSGKPLEAKDYTSARIAEDFKTVCDAFGVVKPVLVGWSLGGAIVVDVVTAYGASYLGGVVYVGGSIPALHYHPAFMHDVLKALVPQILSERTDDIAAAAAAFVDSCVYTPLPYPVRLQWMGGFVAQPRASRLYSVRRAQDHTVWEATARPLPVLVVQGLEDQHCVHEGMVPIVRRVYDDVEVRLLENVGHSPHFESPEETNRFILEWAKEKIVA